MKPSKNQLEQLELERPVIINSSKRLIINEIWYLKTDCAEDAELEKGKKRIKLLLLQASFDMLRRSFRWQYPHLPLILATWNSCVLIANAMNDAPNGPSHRLFWHRKGSIEPSQRPLSTLPLTPERPRQLPSCPPASKVSISRIVQGSKFKVQSSRFKRLGSKQEG